MPTYFSLSNLYNFALYLISYMGLFKSILESASVLQLLLICFTPLIPFLFFELINNLKNDNDDDDDDLNGGLNILVSLS